VLYFESHTVVCVLATLEHFGFRCLLTLRVNPPPPDVSAFVLLDPIRGARSRGPHSFTTAFLVGGRGEGPALPVGFYSLDPFHRLGAVGPTAALAFCC
jgi:hypothetical protein